MLFVSVVAVDENHQVGGVDIHLGSLVVAGWSSYATYLVSVNRQTFYINHASSYSFVWLAGFAYAQRKSIAFKLVCIKSADAVAVGYARQVHQIHQRISLVEFLALEHSADKGF